MRRRRPHVANSHHLKREPCPIRFALRSICCPNFFFFSCSPVTIYYYSLSLTTGCRWGQTKTRWWPRRFGRQNGRGVYDWRGRCQRQSTVMVLRVPPQRPSIAVGLATPLCLALERFLVAVRQHVTISGGIKRERQDEAK